MAAVEKPKQEERHPPESQLCRRAYVRNGHEAGTQLFRKRTLGVDLAENIVTEPWASGLAEVQTTK